MVSLKGKLHLAPRLPAGTDEQNEVWGSEND